MDFLTLDQLAPDAVYALRVTADGSHVIMVTRATAPQFNEVLHYKRSDACPPGAVLLMLSPGSYVALDADPSRPEMQDLISTDHVPEPPLVHPLMETVWHDDTQAREATEYEEWDAYNQPSELWVAIRAAASTLTGIVFA